MCGLLIGKHLNISLRLFTDPQLHTLDCTICRALRFVAVHRVPNLPRTALYRPTSNLCYGLPSLTL
jgi:hypothetical protein